MCNLLESPHSSVSLYFPNDQCAILQNRAWVKDPFKVQDKPMDFNITNMRSSPVDFRFHTPIMLDTGELKSLKLSNC